MAAAIYTFGDFELNTAFRRLAYRGAAISLAPKAFDVLLVLVRAAGGPVTKDEFNYEIWGGREVSDANLAVAISTVRAALRAAAGRDEYIVTLPGCGYQFAGSVHASGAYTRDLPRSPKAFRSYRRAAHFLGQSSYLGTMRAIALFEESLKDDPMFTPALSGIAAAYASAAISLYMKSSFAFPLARRYATQALDIDPESLDAHCVLAQVLMFYDYDWKAAGAVLRRAAALETKSLAAQTLFVWYSLFRDDERSAVDDLERLIATGVVSPAINALWALLMFFTGKYNDALEHLRELLAVTPESPLLQWYSAATLAQLGRYREAIEATPIRPPEPYLPQSLGIIGFCSARLGENMRAEECANALASPSEHGVVSHVYRAVVLMGMDRKTEAIEALRMGLHNREATMPFVAILPFFESLRGGRRFEELLADLNLRRGF